MSEPKSIGTPEEKPQVTFLPVAGFSNYRVGDDGSVWSLNGYGPKKSRKPGEWHRLRTVLNRSGNNGRQQVTLRAGSIKISKPVHRLVLETFVGPCPEGCCACHNNGDGLDNRLENLRWDTQANNIADAVRQGTFSRGNKHGSARLNEEQVRSIRERHAAGTPMAHLAKEFGVAPYSIRGIVTGRTWRHLLNEEDRRMPLKLRCRHCSALRKALGEAQGLFGEAEGVYSNDRDPDRADKLHAILRRGFDVCLAAISKFDGGQNVIH